ncbi:MAG: AraC family transcriptional regulator [Gemmatimonadaceae bacterium]|nr:AraC family transcriptional regulator [Gemmatimonadaceae bacterium]
MLLRTRRPANTLLAGLVLVVALRLVPYIIGYAGFYDAYPWLSFAPFDIPLALGPLLWLYVVRLTTGGLPRHWVRHLTPAAVHFAFLLIVFVGFTVPQKDRIDAIIMRWLGPVITTGSLAGIALYSAAALRQYRRYQHWLDDEYSNREQYRLAWLRGVILLFAITGALWLAFSITHWFIVPLNYFDQFPLYLWLAGLSYVLGLLAWRGTAVDYPPITETVAVPDPTDWQAIGESILARIEQEAHWQDAALTLPLLARRLDVSPTRLSRALNQGLGINFNTCINRMRVHAVAARLAAGDGRDLLQIAFEAGFNSKPSFQRAFREYRGESPSAYRERVQHRETTH